MKLGGLITLSVAGWASAETIQFESMIVPSVPREPVGNETVDPGPGYEVRNNVPVTQNVSFDGVTVPLRNTPIAETIQATTVSFLASEDHVWRLGKKTEDSKTHLVLDRMVVDDKTCDIAINDENKDSINVLEDQLSSYDALVTPYNSAIFWTKDEFPKELVITDWETGKSTVSEPLYVLGILGKYYRNMVMMPDRKTIYQTTEHHVVRFVAKQAGNFNAGVLECAAFTPDSVVANYSATIEWVQVANTNDAATEIGANLESLEFTDLFDEDTEGCVETVVDQCLSIKAGKETIAGFLYPNHVCSISLPAGKGHSDEEPNRSHDYRIPPAIAYNEETNALYLYRSNRRNLFYGNYYPGCGCLFRLEITSQDNTDFGVNFMESQLCSTNYIRGSAFSIARCDFSNDPLKARLFASVNSLYSIPGTSTLLVDDVGGVAHVSRQRLRYMTSALNLETNELAGVQQSFHDIPNTQVIRRKGDTRCFALYDARRSLLVAERFPYVPPTTPPTTETTNATGDATSTMTLTGTVAFGSLFLTLYGL